MSAIVVSGCSADASWGSWIGASTHIDLRILESLLEVLVDSLIGDLTDQGEI